MYSHAMHTTGYIHAHKKKKEIYMHINTQTYIHICHAYKQVSANRGTSVHTHTPIYVYIHTYHAYEQVSANRGTSTPDRRKYDKTVFWQVYTYIYTYIDAYVYILAGGLSIHRSGANIMRIRSQCCGTNIMRIQNGCVICHK
jgi:hypothetical protein